MSRLRVGDTLGVAEGYLTGIGLVAKDVGPVEEALSQLEVPLQVDEAVPLLADYRQVLVLAHHPVHLLDVARPRRSEETQGQVKILFTCRGDGPRPCRGGRSCSLDSAGRSRKGPGGGPFGKGWHRRRGARHSSE